MLPLAVDRLWVEANATVTMDKLWVEGVCVCVCVCTSVLCVEGQYCLFSSAFVQGIL